MVHFLDMAWLEKVHLLSAKENGSFVWVLLLIYKLPDKTTIVKKEIEKFRFNTKQPAKEEFEKLLFKPKQPAQKMLLAFEKFEKYFWIQFSNHAHNRLGQNCFQSLSQYEKETALH